MLRSPDSPLMIQVLRLRLFPLGDYSTWNWALTMKNFFLQPSHKDYFLYLILLLPLEPG